MRKQCIVTIAREYGSGGHVVGQRIAETLGIKYYDRNLLEEIVGELGLSDREYTFFDENSSGHILKSNAGDDKKIMEDEVAKYQFDYMRKLAKEGESFVIVGRCAEWILRDFIGKTSVFITGEDRAKRKRIMNEYGYTEQEANAAIRQADRNRSAYHDRYSEVKWGDARGYDLCISTSVIGVDACAELILQYIKAKEMNN